MEKELQGDTLFSKHVLEKCNIPNAIPKSSLFVCTEVDFFEHLLTCRKTSHVMVIALLQSTFKDGTDELC